MIRLGENGDGRGARIGVAPGGRAGVRFGGQRAGRRRPALDLGNDAETRPAQRPGEVAKGRRQGQPVAQRLDRHFTLCGSDSLAPRRQYGGEPVHAATACSSVL